MSSSLWNEAALPAVAAVPSSPVEVGVRFYSDTDGYVTGLRFYKGPGNTGVHVGSLWTAEGTVLGRATFQNESAAGWQQVDFASPVPVTAGTTYVASYLARSGNYSVDEGYFSAYGVDSGPLHAPQDAAAAPNGLYAFGDPSTFPTLSNNARNYWVDVVFDTAFAPEVTSVRAFDGEPDGVWDANITARFNGPMDAASVNGATVQLRDASDAVVPSTVTYDAATKLVTIDPAAPLATGTAYTVFVRGGTSGVHSVTGTALAADYTTSFDAVETQLYSVWDSSATPAAPVWDDSRPVELGVKFRSDADGFITGVRFYKGPGNTGTHTGSLWSAGGTLLGTATFSAESATGWQQVSFASPVAVTAGATYVASYFAPVGNYAVDVSGFSGRGEDRGALHVLPDGASGTNGVYAYSAASTFPTSSINANNYWVDPVFYRPETPPTTPDLSSGTDTGASDTDNLTSSNSPTFTGSARAGSTVRILADGVEVGSAVADANRHYSVTLAPGALSDGQYAVTAAVTTTGPDGLPAALSSSDALVLRIDHTAPSADVVDVAPDPRTAAVDSVQLVLSEPVTGLTAASLRLTRDGVIQSLAGVTLSGPAADGRTYTVGGLTAVTSNAGSYVFSMVAASSTGVRDAAGNAPAADASDGWVMSATVNAAPTNSSLAPASASDPAGTYRTFAAAYRDANGASDLSLVYLRANEFVPNMLDCLYDPLANKLFVRSADGLSLLGGFAPGSPNVISNGHGSLDCSQTTAAVAGTTDGTQLVVNWRVACSAPLTGPNVLYLRARDRGAPVLDSGYQRMSNGVWDVTGGRAPAAPAAPAPPAPATAPGVAQGFSVTYADPDGWENLQNVYLRANAELPWMLDAIYHVPSNRLYLRSEVNGGLLGGFAPGSANVIANGNGTLNCAAVTVTRSGTELTVNWNLTATSSKLAGPNRLFVRARDAAGADTGYVEHAGAAWTVTGNAAPTLVGVTPASSTNASTPGTSGPFRTLFAAYEDSDGVFNLNFVYLSVNASDPARRLQAVYNLVTNRLFLLADDGVSLLGNVAPGSGNVISNSHGSLNCAATSISISGNRLTVLWSVSATPALTGPNTISLRARDRGGLDTGFRLISGVTWTIT